MTLHASFLLLKVVSRKPQRYEVKKCITLSPTHRVVFDTGAAFDETLSIRPVGSEDESDEILIPNNFTNGDLQETNYVELHSGVYE